MQYLSKILTPSGENKNHSISHASLGEGARLSIVLYRVKCSTMKDALLSLRSGENPCLRAPAGLVANYFVSALVPGQAVTYARKPNQEFGFVSVL